MAVDILTQHSNIPINTYILMHADDIVAIAKRDSISLEVKLLDKLPFGLRNGEADFESFMDWLRRRVDNLQRSYMNKVYMVRKVGRELENILRDSCALSITDQFWVNRSDVNTTWAKLQELRDQNETLAKVALSGETANLDWNAAIQGATSLFATKGAFPKAIIGKYMQKLGGTQEREWVASVIGKALGLPVQDVTIKNPSISGSRNEDGFVLASTPNDDTLVEIKLFTSKKISLVHASELFVGSGFGEAHRDGQHHRYFYDRLPNEELKRDFERVLILNWLLSNHDMHGENFGCLYSPETFEIIGIAPSFDHNSSDFDGTIPEIDVPDILASSIKYHNDVIAKMELGSLETVLEEIQNWLTPDQKNGVRAVGAELLNLYKNSEKLHDEI